ncbi:hypothetical protein IFM89_020198 [Coptis chinensis]|uniref:SP-RING-type domain-containing protein n=1 Tax=Coptis chinensis TaxID=261450 RepID=A0A835LJ87_9MAGN|nr:hypothetical protein IFM89_020198 [Coptis chinensis]
MLCVLLLVLSGVPIRTTNRPGTQLLGANGRDDGPAITTCTREGINKIILSGCDARIFCLGVRIARRRTVKQVLNLIPKEADGELFEDAVARVCRCIGGGNATDNAGSDSDLEVVADTVTVNLRCPMSGSRMKIVGRFKPCAHMGCFDLDTFVELNQRSRKLRGCGEEVTEIDVKPDGSWRVKNGDEHSDDLLQWHFPDSSLCVIPDRDIKPDLETLKQIKQGGSEGHTSLKLKIKKNHNEIWQVSKPENMHSLSSENHFEQKFVNQSHKIMPMTNSTTGSCREGEDPSVNQDGAGQYCFSANNGIELDSVSMNFESAYGATNRKHSAPSTNADIIILTDSEDDNGNLVSPEAIYATGQADAIDIHFSVPTPGLPNSYPEDPGVSTSGGICLFPCNDNEIGMPPWPSMTSGTQGGTGFQLFGAEADVSDAIVDVQHTSNPCPASLNGYALGTDTTECGRLVPYPVCPTSTTVNDGLVETPLAFGGDDPSLQIFLPARPTGSSVQADLRVHADMSNGLRTEDWISLRLGGGGSDHGDSTGRRQQYASKEGRMETLADTASLILSMSDDRSGRAITDKQRFGGPFSHPRQPRSVRPRLYLSIDSDSD